MKRLPRFALTTAMCFATAAALAAAGQSREAGDKTKAKDSDQRPRLQLQARPQISMSPSSIILTAELIGGANNYEDYYCPTIEWDWGDDTTSETTSDCDPYDPAKSEIRRRFTVERIYRRSGTFQVTFRLKRHDKLLGSATTTIEVRPGLRDMGQ